MTAQVLKGSVFPTSSPALNTNRSMWWDQNILGTFPLISGSEGCRSNIEKLSFVYPQIVFYMSIKGYLMCGLIYPENLNLPLRGMCLKIWNCYNKLINEHERESCVSEVKLEIVLNLTRHQSEFQTLFCHLQHPEGLRSWDRFACNSYPTISSDFVFSKLYA